MGSYKKSKKDKKRKREDKKKKDKKDKKDKKEKKEKKQKKQKKAKRESEADTETAPAEQTLTSPKGFRMSEFFEDNASPTAEYSAISGKKIKRTIEMTDEDKKREAKRLKKLEKLNQKHNDADIEWGKKGGPKFDPAKLKDPAVDNLLAKC